MDPAVLDQLRQGDARHLAPDPVERRQDDGLRRVVDDEVDARQVLERADVATLTTDDASRHAVRRPLAPLLVAVGPQPDRFLARGDLALAPERVRLALSLVQQPLALLAGRAEPRLATCADGQRASDPSNEKADQNPDDDQHGRAPRSV